VSSSAWPTVGGPIFTATTLELAALGVLQRTLALSLAEIARQATVATPALPRSWMVAHTFSRFPEDQVPAVVVTSPGLARPPERRPARAWMGWFGLVVGVECQGTRQDQVDAMVRLYAGAVRHCLLLHPSLDGVASDCKWFSEDYQPAPIDERRSRGVCLVGFELLVEQLVDQAYGPLEPPETDGSDPVVQVVEADVTVGYSS
jgi:hypothetical protein